MLAGSVELNGFNQIFGSLSGTAGLVGLGSATLTLGGNNTSSTFDGSILGPGTLVKTGAGAFTLNNTANTFGNLVINGGSIQTANDATLGPNPAITVNAAGTLLYTASTSTARTFNLNFGTLAAAAGDTVTLNGAAVNGGFMRGPGTFALTGGTMLAGVTTQNSAVLNQTGPASFVNVTNGSPLTIATGVTSTMTGLTNQGSGAITLGSLGRLNVSDFQSYGTLTINPAAVTENYSQTTLMTNVGTSPLYFNGGSRTFVGTPQTAVFGQGSPQAGQPTFVAGIDLNGKNAVVAGGLFVNNGYVEDSTNNFAGTATIIADFGSLVKGAGFFQNSVVTLNGGRFQAGNSPGIASFGKFALGPGGVASYVFAIDDATGTAGPIPDAAGHVSGWSLVNVIGPRLPYGGPDHFGDFTWTATPADRLTVSLQTLVNPTTVGVDEPGMMDHFDPSQPYSWLAVTWSGAYAGPADAAVLDAATNFDASSFFNPIDGRFGWALDKAGQTLSLTYTPSTVPEPDTFVLSALAGLGWAVRRRQSV
jgi:autotransporter-associated beta strand protein